MTTVITRYFETAECARATKDELRYRRNFPSNIVRVFETTDGLTDALIAENVEAATAKAYETRMAQGGAVVMVLAGYKPLGVAQTTRNVAADNGAHELDGVVEEVRVKTLKTPGLSILPNHPRFLTRDRDPSRTNFHMADWPIPLISRRKPSTVSILEPHQRMANWPIPLLSRRKPYTGSIIPRHGRMANFPLPLLSRRKPYTGSILPRHGRMANFPIPLINRRKPYTGTMIGRHTRMANWPFPHLINGKTGTNSLIPGAPRMANFPIPLLSDRKPFTGSIVPRHGRMANFPIPLISKRKPYDETAIPRHGRMADFPLPLVIPRDDPEAKEEQTGFSLSKALGLRTIIRR
ncbi:MAG: PucR family transcriptional regulator [Pseudomonadota bacterium]